MQKVFPCLSLRLFVTTDAVCVIFQLLFKVWRIRSGNAQLWQRPVAADNVSLLRSCSCKVTTLVTSALFWIIIFFFGGEGRDGGGQGVWRGGERENRYLVCGQLFRVVAPCAVCHSCVQVASVFVPAMLIWDVQWKLVSWTWCFFLYQCVKKIGDKILPNFIFPFEQRPLPFSSPEARRLRLHLPGSL